ncbi:MAG: hypothetical protein ACRD33_02775 [Candidatus Acidiferrales bacterium]
MTKATIGVLCSVAAGAILLFAFLAWAASQSPIQDKPLTPAQAARRQQILVHQAVLRQQILAQQPAIRAAAKKKIEAGQHAELEAGAGAKILRDGMRDPDSFQLTRVRMTLDGAVCYDYRGQNGFGATVSGHAVAWKGILYPSETAEAFAGLWNRECVGKGGVDRTTNVTFAMNYLSR